MGRELRRVPLDFDWPLKETWAGYLNPFYAARAECPACDGSGYGPEAKRFADQWYGHAPFDPVAYGATPLTVDHPAVVEAATRNVDRSPEYYGVPYVGRDEAIRKESGRLFDHWKGQWSHHLIQADVDALIASHRLHDFTDTFVPGTGWVAIDPPPAVTPEEVNAWSLSGMGHDAINRFVCVRARCEREGVPVDCPECDGSGETWPSRAHKALAESWEHIDPPKGDGYQCWETTSEGSPISPVFATAEELARWLADTGASACGSQTATYDQWLAFVRGPGWAPDLVGDGDTLRSGVEAVSDT